MNTPRSSVGAAALSALVAAAGCTKTGGPTPSSTSGARETSSAGSRPNSGAPSSQPATAPSSRPSSARAAAANARAAESRARLSRGPAGQLILAAIEAHGGLEAWLGAGALTFRYDYQPVKGVRRNSLQTVDILSARAIHTLSHPVRGRFGWDGTQAWMKLEGGASYPARFWALTPYYFVGMPFVLADPGVRLEIVDDDPTQAGFPVSTRVVRATFEPGTGDAPDDYYVLYLDAASSRVLGLRYVVSYAPFMKAGMDHTPEKLLVYEAYAPAGDLTLARRHVFFTFAEGNKGDRVTAAEVSEVEVGVKLGPTWLEAPDGAVIDDSLDEPSRR